MSINLNQPLSPFTRLKMFNNKTKQIGMAKDKIQVIISFPDICKFNKKIHHTIKTFSSKAECFIVTSSSKENTTAVIKEFDLNTEFISLDFDHFASVFDLKDDKHKLKKSLMIINKYCQIAHKEIL